MLTTILIYMIAQLVGGAGRHLTIMVGSWNVDFGLSTSDYQIELDIVQDILHVKIKNTEIM